MCLANLDDSLVRHIQRTLLVDAIATKAGVRATTGRVIGGHWHIQTAKGLIRSTDLLNSYRAQVGVRRAA